MGRKIEKPWKYWNLPIGFFLASSGDKTAIIEVQLTDHGQMHTMWKDPKDVKYTFWMGGPTHIPAFGFWVMSHNVDELRYLGDTIPERFYDFIDESLDFQRGIDPKKSLDVGSKRSRNKEELERDLAQDLKKYMMPLSKRPFVFTKINRWFSATGEPGIPAGIKIQAWFNDYGTSRKFYEDFKKDFKQWIKDHTKFNIWRMRKHRDGYVEIRLTKNETS